MTVDDWNANYEGVVLIWGHRPRVGLRGYLQLKERLDDAEILFFDQNCLRNRDCWFRQGDVVRFQLQPRMWYQRFEASSFKRITTFAKKLRTPKDAVSRLFYDRLPHDVQDLLADPKAQKEKLKEALAHYFNDIVRSVDLPSSDLLSPELKLSDFTECLQEFVDFYSAVGECQLRLNSLILMDTFPDHITTDQECSRLLPLNIVAVEKTVEQIPTPVRLNALIGEVFPAEQYGCVLLANNAQATFRYAYFPDQSFLPDTGLPVSCRVIKSPTGLLAFDIWPLGGPFHDDNDIAQELPSSLKDYSPLSDTKRGSQKSADDKVTTPKLHDSEISYDIPTHHLVLKNSRSVEVPKKYQRVLEFMLEKVGGTSYLRSHANYEEIALRFERGKIEKDHSDLSQDKVKEKLRVYQKQISRHAEHNAQEFARDFKRWLKHKGIDPKAVIRYSNKGYEFSYGWDLKRMKRGCSEVGLVRGDVDHIAASSDQDHSDKSSQTTSPSDYDAQGYNK